jgi:integrase
MNATTDTVTPRVQWPSGRLNDAMQEATPGKTYRAPDKSGFALRVNKDGTMVWVHHFRNGAEWANGVLGSAALITGDGKLSFEDAAEKFRRLKDGLAKTKRVKAEGLTFSRGFDLYVSGRVSKRTELPLSSQTLRGLNVHFKNDLKGAYGWHLETATSLEWQTLLMPVKERSPHNARRCFWLVHGMYAHLKDYKLISCDNPLAMENMRRLFSPRALKKPRNSHLKALDMRAFFKAVARLKFKTAQEAIRLLMHLGWRRSAVLRMRWEQVNFEQGFYTVRPGDRGWKGYVGPIAMSEHALAVLVERKMRLLDERPRTGKLLEAQMQRKAGSEEWVFPAYRGGVGPMGSVQGSFRTVSRSLPYQVRAHDLRRGFSTLANIVLSGDRFMVGRLISHQQLAHMDESAGSLQTDDYIAKYLKAERIAANRVGDAIEAIASGRPDDVLRAKLHERGMDLEHLELMDLDDDDIDAIQDEGAAQ